MTIVHLRVVTDGLDDAVAVDDYPASPANRCRRTNCSDDRGHVIPLKCHPDRGIKIHCVWRRVVGCLRHDMVAQRADAFDLGLDLIARAW